MLVQLLISVYLSLLRYELTIFCYGFAGRVLTMTLSEDIKVKTTSIVYAVPLFCVLVSLRSYRGCPLTRPSCIV